MIIALRLSMGEREQNLRMVEGLQRTGLLHHVV